MTTNIPPHHTAEYWAAKPRRTQAFVVRDVADCGPDHIRLLSTDSWGFARKKADLGREIRVGEHLQLETIGLSHITGLRDVNGWLFQLTNQQLADEAREYSEELHRKDVVRLEQHRKKWAEQEAALPAWLQARIQRFRDAGGEHFLLTGWGYELCICRLADLMDRGLDADAEQLASGEGVTGNQWDCAKALVAGRREHGNDFARQLPAGIAPITGSADYS